jgi:hypothetical protein
MNAATNMQNLEMLKLQNLLVPADSSVVGASTAASSSTYQNPMAQFLPYSMQNTASGYSFALGGSGKKKN